MVEVLDKSQPVLMDEEMVNAAALEQLPGCQTARIAKEEGIHPSEILKLRLEVRNILRIDHLLEFTSLTKLDLNNNIIEKIGGLDGLVNLTWLNLSFNSIQRIEGLESLRMLKVLNLTNNRISVIENMDTVENLTHFLFANNHLGRLDNVLYLRKFKNLFTLNLRGNPASKQDDYRFFIAAYFPDLKFLDYKLLEEKTKNEASIKYHYVLEKMREEELQVQQAVKADEAEVELHKDAFVEFLNGSYLFKSMFKKDPVTEMLHCMPGVDTLLLTFESQMVELCTQLFDMGLVEHKRREKEVSSFHSGQTKAVTGCQQKASQILAKFEQEHKERIAELQQLADPDLVKAKINHCNNEVDELSNSLMALEVQLVSQMEDLIKRFDISVSDMVGNFSETVQGIFVQIRNLEDDYHEKLQRIAVTTLENVAKDTLDEDLPEDVKMLFTDKGTVMDAVAGSHNDHLLVINDRETQLGTRVNAWKVALAKEIQDKDLKQSRIRISDIHRYVDHLREQLEELQ